VAAKRYTMRWVSGSLGALLLVVGCGRDRTDPGPQAPHVASSPQTATGQAPAEPNASPALPATPPSSAAVRVEIRSQGIWWGKPPLKTHFLDATVQNLANEPRWIALAEMFPYAGTTDPPIGKGKVAELQVFELSSRPRVVLVLTVATGGIWAVRLPSRAKVTLRRLPIESWWEDVPPSAELEVVSAREILVGGKPLATCFDVKATSDSGGDVKAPRDAADPRMVRTRCPPGEDSVPIELVDAQRSRVTVQLTTEPDM